MFFLYDGSSSAWLSLTSFKTILLDCIVTAVTSVCIFKKSKLVSFYVSILISKMKEDTQHFRCIMLYFFNKGKNATEVQERFVQ